MTLIFICHPWAGKQIYNEQTKHICWHIATVDKQTPFSPALHFNQFLADEVPEQRDAGINGGLRILSACDVMYVYTMHGISKGMQAEIDYAEKIGLKMIKFEKYPWDDNVTN